MDAVPLSPCTCRRSRTAVLHLQGYPAHMKLSYQVARQHAGSASEQEQRQNCNLSCSQHNAPSSVCSLACNCLEVGTKSAVIYFVGDVVPIAGIHGKSSGGKDISLRRRGILRHACAVSNSTCSTTDIPCGRQSQSFTSSFCFSLALPSRLVSVSPQYRTTTLPFGNGQ